ncbi:hypothetical protein ABIA06_003092 [Bradyrhizobium yuanmingense]
MAKGILARCIRLTLIMCDNLYSASSAELFTLFEIAFGYRLVPDRAYLIR